MNQNFSIVKILKKFIIKKIGGNVIFPENSIYSQILVTKLKRNQNFSISKIFKNLIQ